VKLQGGVVRMRFTGTLLTCVVTSFFLTASVRAAFAEDPVTLELSLNDHKFEPAEMKAPAGKPIIIKVMNRDQTPEEFESTALKIEKIVAGQSEIMVRVRPLAAGRYPFIGEYHPESASGVLIVE